jgi:hypothetical protein
VGLEKFDTGNQGRGDHSNRDGSNRVRFLTYLSNDGDMALEAVKKYLL